MDKLLKMLKRTAAWKKNCLAAWCTDTENYRVDWLHKNTSK